MAVTVPKPVYSIGAGALLWAPIGTTEPSHTVSGGVFTDAWPAGWLVLGATASGHVWNYVTNVEPVDAAEFFDPLGYEVESMVGRVEAQLLNIVASTIAIALNGGSKTTTGSGATLKTVVKPPAVGSEVRGMLGWEGKDAKARWVARQTLQGGEIAIPQNKGAGNKAVIPVTFNFEVPDSGLDIFDMVYAGTRAV